MANRAMIVIEAYGSINDGLVEFKVEHDDEAEQDVIRAAHLGHQVLRHFFGELGQDFMGVTPEELFIDPEVAEKEVKRLNGESN